MRTKISFKAILTVTSVWNTGETGDINTIEWAASMPDRQMVTLDNCKISYQIVSQSPVQGVKTSSEIDDLKQKFNLKIILISH